MLKMKPVVRKEEGSWQIFSIVSFSSKATVLLQALQLNFRCVHRKMSLWHENTVLKKGVGIVSRNNHHVTALLFLKISISYFDKRREPRSNPSAFYVSYNGIRKAFRLININFTI